MILCFSGTGNTRQLAKYMSQSLGDTIQRVAPGFYYRPDKFVLNVEDGRLIWMMPVNAWGMPKMVRQLAQKMRIVSTNGKPIRHYVVFSCGDDIGYADRQWRNLLKSIGETRIGGAFSVQMPNIYTFLPGFDVDTPELAQSKLDAAPERIQQIAQQIADNKGYVTDVVRGRFPNIKTTILYPLFMYFLTGTKSFHVEDTCNRCGRCAQLCPMSNIKLNSDKPEWGTKCTLCTRCYHVCPTHSIRYGKWTKKKGQYLNPIFNTAHQN